MIATHVNLNLGKPATSYAFAAIASPAAMYFTRGVQPVSVWLADSYTRAAPGGTGEAKTGGNYAGAFAGQLEALAHGCEQVVWLDATEHQWVEEMGGMNLFFVYGSGPDARITTPAPTDAAPGITRTSPLTLARPDTRGGGRDVGRAGKQAAIGPDHEVFARGTAAVSLPVGAVRGAAALDHRRRRARPGHDAAVVATAGDPVRAAS